MRGYSFKRRCVLLACCTNAICVGFLYALALFTDDLRKAFLLTRSEIEAVSACSYFAAMAGQLPAGLLFDLFGPRWVGVVSIVAYAATQTSIYLLLRFGVSVHYGWLMAIYATMGLASASNFIAVLRIIGEWLGPDSRLKKRCKGLVSLLYSISALGVSVLYYLGDKEGREKLEIAQLCIVIFSCVTAFFSMFLLREIDLTESEAHEISQDFCGPEGQWSEFVTSDDDSERGSVSISASPSPAEGFEEVVIRKPPVRPAAVPRLPSLPAFNADRRRSVVEPGVEGGGDGLPSLDVCRTACESPKGITPRTVNRIMLIVEEEDEGTKKKPSRRKRLGCCWPGKRKRSGEDDEEDEEAEKEPGFSERMRELMQEYGPRYLDRWRTLLRRPRTWAFFAFTFCINGIAISCYYSLDAISDSLGGGDEQGSLYVVVFVASQLLGAVATVLASLRFGRAEKGSGHSLFSYAISAVLSLACVLFYAVPVDHLYGLIPFVGFSHGAFYVVVSDYCRWEKASNTDVDSPDFGQRWGFMSVAMALGPSVFDAVSEAFYRDLEEPGRDECKGHDCYAYFFLACGGFTIVTSGVCALVFAYLDSFYPASAKRQKGLVRDDSDEESDDEEQQK